MLKIISPPSTDKSKSAVVVGNGPSTYKNGDLIDSFDVVIRLNNYQLQGYEEYVGSKTTIWCYYGDATWFVYPNVQKRILPPLENVWVRMSSKYPKKSKIVPPMIRQAHWAGAFVSEIPRRIYAQTEKAIRHEASTGLVAVLAALEYFGRVSISNFSGLISNQYSHYWSKRVMGQNGGAGWHCWDRERKFLKTLDIEFLRGTPIRHM